MGVEIHGIFCLFWGSGAAGRGPRGARAGRGRRPGSPRPAPDRCRGRDHSRPRSRLRRRSSAPFPRCRCRAGPDPARCEQRPAGTRGQARRLFRPGGGAGGAGRAGAAAPRIMSRIEALARARSERAKVGPGAATQGVGGPPQPPLLGACFPPLLLPPHPAHPPPFAGGKLARIAAPNPKPQFEGFRPSPPSWGGKVRGWGASIGYALWGGPLAKRGGRKEEPPQTAPHCVSWADKPPRLQRCLRPPGQGPPTPARPARNFSSAPTSPPVSAAAPAPLPAWKPPPGRKRRLLLPGWGSELGTPPPRFDPPQPATDKAPSVWGN